ncbi:MAG: DUF3307 domain-containing protein [Caldilineales bacterium]
MNSVFWMLMLAHLVGDYPLQPDWMVQAKRTWRGLTLHVGVHLAMLLLLAGTGRPVLWPFLLALAAMHFAIDAFKNWLNRVRPAAVSGSYIFDQFLHLISLLLVAAWITAVLPADAVPHYGSWMIYASGFLAATYAWYITERVVVRRNKAYLAELNGQRWARMAARGLWLALFLVAGGMLRGTALLAAVAAPLPYLSGHYRGRALGTDVAVSLVTAVVVLFALGVS